MTDTTVTDSPPVFGPDGRMMGNQTSNQGQSHAAALQPQSPLSALGPPPAPTPPPPKASVNYPSMPHPGQQQQLPKAPDAKEYEQNSMAFASAMAVLGAVAGRFTRAPGSSALGAFAGALKGWQTGNMEMYESSAKKWEQDTKTALENNRQVMEKYKIALADRQANIDQQMSNIQLISAQYHDQIMYDLAASKNYTAVAQKYEKNVEFEQKARDAATKLKQHGDEIRQKNEQSAAYWLSPEGQARLPQLSTAQQAGVKQMIDLYAAKQQGRPPRSGPAMSLAQFKEDFQAEHGRPPNAQEMTQFSADYAGTVSAARATATAEPKADTATLTQLTKQKASIESFERTAIANGEKLKQLADKVDRTGVPAIERWVRGGRQATGDVDVAEFNTQMQVYRAEVAKIISNPNLTGVLSDKARQEVDGFMSGGASAKQIRAVVDLLTQDFGRRSKSIDDEIETVRSHLKGGKAPAVGGGDSGGWGKAQVVQ